MKGIGVRPPTEAKHGGSIDLQLMITINILAAELINYSTNKINAEYMWRVSLASVAGTVAIITTGTLFLPDTTNSLLECSHADEACCIRGMANIDEEYANLVAASEEARQVEHPW
jgi:MFS transporter, SP family, sugar:H+ symporter